MKKTTRLNALIKCVGVITEVFTRKANRVLRAVDQAIDCAKDSADEARCKAAEELKKLGDATSYSDSGKLKEILCNYGKNIEEAERWDRYAGYYEKLKEQLNEEVEVEETPQQ